MLTFKKKQKIYTIGNLKIGGQPGELPTVLIGNIFYKGMPEISDHKKGNFDKKAATKWIKIAERFSEKSNVPHLLDVMAMYPEAMCRFIEFVSEKTTMPFLIDGANPETRIAALKTIKHLGLENQVIFNGIVPTITNDELDALKQSGIITSVLMAYNEFDYSPKGRISALLGSAEQRGLLDLAEKSGQKKMLVDTVVFDVPSISYASEAIKLVKNGLGFPSGCSPANATYHWKQLLKSSILKEGFSASNAAAHTIAQCCGSDFLIYGPIKQAKNIIPASAVNDAIIAYYVRRFGIKPLTNNHPLYKIF